MTETPEPRPMDIAVMGLMRTGSTLLADLLTQPGKSLIISEPNLLGLWDADMQEKLHKLYGDFGLTVGDAPPEAGRYRYNFEYFDAAIRPQLAGLDFWGAKYVDLWRWRKLFGQYRPKKLILCVRDLRDVAISGLELMNRMGLIFADAKHRRDEAWLMARLSYSIHELMILRQRADLVVRYEDLVDDEATRAKLAAFVGLSELGSGRLNLEMERATRSLWEMKKHGNEITTKSLDRFDREAPGPVQVMAERLWRLFPEYSLAFGYEVAAPALRLRKHDFALRPSGENPLPYKEVERWNWRGPQQIEPMFGRRRARILVSRNLKKGASIIDLGSSADTLVKLLPAESAIVPVDVVRRAPRFVRSAIYDYQFPPAEKANLVLALGVLEYANDLSRFLKQLRSYNLPCFVSYYATDDDKGADRAGLGWRNHHSRNELMRMFLAAGFQPVAKWAFDGQQSVFRLTPKANLARPKRRPRNRLRILPSGRPRKDRPNDIPKIKGKVLEPA